VQMSAIQQAEQLDSVLSELAELRAENMRLTSEMEARTRDLSEIASMAGFFEASDRLEGARSEVAFTEVTDAAHTSIIAPLAGEPVGVVAGDEVDVVVPALLSSSQLKEMEKQLSDGDGKEKGEVREAEESQESVTDDLSIPRGNGDENAAEELGPTVNVEGNGASDAISGATLNLDVLHAELPIDGGGAGPARGDYLSDGSETHSIRLRASSVARPPR